MKPLVLFLILFLALAGMGTIWYITSRDKCVVPTDSTGCPAGQAYYCPTADGTATCDTFDKVCGKWLSGMDYDHCVSIDCQYDTDSKKNIWKCNGTPSSAGGPSKGSPCTITKGLLDQSTLKGTTLETNKIPASNSASYYHDTYYKGCRLDTCEKGYDPFPDGAGAYLCIPHGMINVQNTACTNYVPDNDYTTGLNNNFDWVNTYIDPTIYGKTPQLVCKEYRCAGDIGSTKPYTCTKSDPSICQNYTIGGVSHIASWENSTGCRIKTCDGQGEWVVPDDGDPDLTGTGTGSANTARCHPNCTMNIPVGSGTTYDRPSNSCKVSSCTDGWKLNGDHCEPDCSTSDNITKFLFKGTTPISSGFFYQARAVQDSKQNWICVPNQATQSNPFGGCGDATHTAYGVDSSDGTATFCQPTVNGNTAKYNTDAAGTLGCLACQPRMCPPWATTLDKCIGDVENDCGYTNEEVVGDENVPVQTCMTEVLNSGLNIWKKFDAYDEQANYDDPAAFNKGSTITIRKTSGALLIDTPWRLFFKQGTSKGDFNINIRSYTSDLTTSEIEIPNFTPTNYSSLEIWTWNIQGYDSSHQTFTVNGLYTTIKMLYLSNDNIGDSKIVIVLDGTAPFLGKSSITVSAIIAGSKTFLPPFLAPLNF